jgi:hypothetical protein
LISEIVVSFLCTAVLALLCFSEVTRFFSVTTKSDMLVDATHHHDRLNINIDIVFPKMPCDLITLSVQDVMGTNIADIFGTLHKKRIS